MNKLFSLIVIFMMNAAIADTCPPVDSVNPDHPPAGWEVRFSPYFPGDKYYFGMVSHTFIGNEDFKKNLLSL